MRKFELAFPEMNPGLLPMLFMTAFPGEAEVLRGNYRFQPAEKVGQMALFRLMNSEIFLAVMGADPSKKIDELENLLQKIHPSCMINYGICGSLDTSLPLFQNFLVTQVKSMDEPIILLFSLASSLYAILGAHFSTRSLLTTPLAIKKPEIRDELFLHTGCHLVDMEGYSFARVAQQLSIPLIILKQPVDYCDAETIANFRNKKPKWQAALKTGLWKLVDTIKDVG